MLCASMPRPRADDRLHSHLRERRSARGIAQGDLARQVGVTRQALHAIEAGRYLPNVSLALSLARALGCRVEDLFAAAAPTGAGVVQGHLLAGSSEAPPTRAKLWSVGGRVFVLPMARLEPSLNYAVPADGVITSRPAPGRPYPRVRVRLWKGLAEIEQTIAVAGCDPAVHLVGQHLRRQADRRELVGWTLGSTAALEALERGEVHVAGIHLLDPRTGESNVPFLRRRLRGRSFTVVTFASWEAGLLVRRGNPKRIRGVGDLARRDIRLVNREPGSGARLLLDEQLRREGVSGERVRGYDDLAASHLEVGRRVAEGGADAGVGVLAIARLHGLDFLPVQTERYDLVIPTGLLQSHPALGPFLDALLSPEVRAEIEALGGYDTRETGRVVDWKGHPRGRTPRR
jgi:molybdate-binding protein/DNA-binding XRE family transcriptional regulator